MERPPEFLQLFGMLDPSFVSSRFQRAKVAQTQISRINSMGTAFKLRIGDFFDNLPAIVAHGIVDMDEKVSRPISEPNSGLLIHKVGRTFSVKYFWCMFDHMVRIWTNQIFRDSEWLCGVSPKTQRRLVKKFVTIVLPLCRRILSSFLSRVRVFGRISKSDDVLLDPRSREASRDWAPSDYTNPSLYLIRGSFANLAHRKIPDRASVRTIEKLFDLTTRTLPMK
jgi:hypothetical protein